MLKKLLTGILLCIIFVSIAAIFWQEELKYSLPTPIPANYQDVALNTIIDSEGKWVDHNQPTFFHFFKPNCPCSRFNLKHYKDLHRSFSGKLNFYLVIPPEADRDWTQDLLDLNIKIIEDQDGQLAKKCGVYSTPQAALINTAGALYFRGNYNKSRYCTVKSSNYAEQAIVALLRRAPCPEFSPYATKAYGCEYTPKSQ